MTAKQLGLSSHEAVSRHIERDVQLYRQQLKKFYPEIDQEYCGIASGLGCSEQMYFTVMYSYYIYCAFEQCTTVGFHNSSDKPLLGKTDDISQNELGMNVLEITRPDKGYRHIQFHFAGTLWTVAGMNECGLAIAMTGIPGPVLQKDGLPSLEALHTILPVCTTVKEAIEHIRSLCINRGGFSLLIGDANGEICLLERTALGLTLIPEQKDEFLIHTNHIIDSEFADENPPQKEPLRSNSVCRYKNGLRIMQDLPRTEDGMKQFLLDRNPGGPICQLGEEDMHTDFAVILRPLDKRLTVYSESPSYSREQTLELDTIFSV